MKGKPIEPGCLALIIKARFAQENRGRVVRVAGRMPEGYIPPDAPIRKPVVHVPEEKSQRWLIEPLPGAPALVGSLVSATGKVIIKYPARQLCCPESWLIRIDDDEEPNETRVTETHKPKAEEVF